LIGLCQIHQNLKLRKYLESHYHFIKSFPHYFDDLWGAVGSEIQWYSCLGKVQDAQDVLGKVIEKVSDILDEEKLGEKLKGLRIASDSA